jgi:luciferase-like monooxygenase
MICMGKIIEGIKKEVLNWPNVTAEPHRFGGIEFRVNKREMGHIHGESVADLPFPMKIRNDLVNSGRASPHHVLPKSGWVSYWINKDKEQEHEVSAVVELFKMRYKQLKPRVQTKQEEHIPL